MDGMGDQKCRNDKEDKTLRKSRIRFCGLNNSRQNANGKGNDCGGDNGEDIEQNSSDSGNKNSKEMPC